MMHHALAHASQGRFVFPAKEGTKIPLVPWGTEATRDLDQVVSWWTRWPRANIGIATKPSGIVVIDTDVLKEGQAAPQEFLDKGIYDGEDMLAYLAEQHGDGSFDWLKTYTVKTPSDGLHRYYWAPDEIVIRNSQPLYGCYKLDVRGGGDGAGGIVFGEGSRNAQGRPYQAVLVYPIATMPLWLQRCCAVRPPVMTRPPIAPRPGAPRGIVPEGLLINLARAPQGQHSSLIYWSACECRDMGVPEAEAVQTLLGVALGWRDSKNGWSERRVATAVQSAYRRQRKA